MKLELKHQDIYDKTFFYTIYRIYSSHNHCTEKSAVQVCILLSLFITVH